MFHMYAIEGILIVGLAAGTTTVSLPRFDPHSYLSAIEKYKVLRAVPEIILGGATFFSDPSTPRIHTESEPPDPPGT